MALRREPVEVQSLDEGIEIACRSMSIGRLEWLSRSKLGAARKQRSIKDFF